MLKTYDKLEDVPEGLREHYKQSGSKWVPELSDDHPTVVMMKTYKQEKETEEARVRKLRTDLDDALEAGKSSGLPRGHVAVPKADADDLPKYRALGSVDEVTTKVTEHGTLKTDSEKRAREDKQRLVAKELDYNADAFLLLPDLPDFEIRDGKDGKKTVIALVKDGDKTVEKPATEFLESSPRHAPLLPALKSSGGGVTVHGSSSTTTPTSTDTFAAAREFGKQFNEAQKAGTDVGARFGYGSAAAN